MTTVNSLSERASFILESLGDAKSVGNGSLFRKWETHYPGEPESAYIAARAELILAGLVKLGRGRGGSVVRIQPETLTISEKQPSYGAVKYVGIVLFVVGLGGVIFPSLSFVPAIRYKYISPVPKIEYSSRRSAPLRVAAALGRHKGCTDMNPELVNNIVRYSQKVGIDPELTASVIAQESQCNPLAVSYKHAIGLMQIVPEVWKSKYDFTTQNLFNPETNIRIGTEILAQYIYEHGEHSGLDHYQGLGNGGNPNYTAQVIQRKKGP